MDLDDEVRLRVLEERVTGMGHMIREVEKCCGGLRGDAHRLGERVVVLEHDLNGKCASMVGEVDGLRVRGVADHNSIAGLQGDVELLRSRLWWFLTVAIGAVLLDVLGLVL